MLLKQWQARVLRSRKERFDLKRIIGFIIAFCMIFTVFGITSASAAKTNTYSYANEEPKISPDAVTVEKVIYGDDIGCGSLSSPQDICYFKGNYYIADSENNRIVVTDKDFKFVSEMNSVVIDGEESSFKNPKGLFASDDYFCIADTDNARVIVMNDKGEVHCVLKKPDSDLYDEKLSFQPQKVLMDENGYFYIINLGSYEGALLYNKDGSFNSYFGGNKITVTLGLLVEEAWRKILNKTQLARVKQNIPKEYGNFDIDSKGFIYTCTSNTTDTTSQIKRLNTSGTNTWEPTENYGDNMEIWNGQIPIVSRMIDVSADENGFLTAIDNEFGHIFQYSAIDGQILFVSGGISSQSGSFATPTAIEADSEGFCVLDASKASVTVFKYTEYGLNVRSAVELFNDGKYDEALKNWQHVIRKNGNMQMAYIGMAKAYYGKEDYETAMHYYEMGGDPEGYSAAFSKQRRDFLRSNFPFICIVVVTILIAGYVVGFIRKKNKKVDYTIKHYKKWQYPFYVVFHPAKGFDDLKWSKQTSLVATVIILGLYFVSVVFKRQATSFMFNSNITEKNNFNILVQFLATIGLFLAFAIINWAVCTLFEGKGRFKEICCYASCALIPTIASNYIYVALSYVFTGSEAAFLNIFNGICIAWTVFLLVRGLGVLHEYEFKKVILSLIATIFGILIVIFFVVLIISLFNRIGSFITSVIDEIIMHSARNGG